MKSYNVKSNAKRFARGIAAKWPGQLEAAEPVAAAPGEWFPAIELVGIWTYEAKIALKAFAGPTCIIHWGSDPADGEPEAEHGNDVTDIIGAAVHPDTTGALFMADNGKGGETPAIKAVPERDPTTGPNNPHGQPDRREEVREPARPAPGKNEPSRPAPKVDVAALAKTLPPPVRRTPEEIAASRAERRQRIEAGEYREPAPTPKPKKETRADIIMRMVSEPEGSTAESIAEACAWQAHTLRGYIGGTLRKRLAPEGKTITAVRKQGEPTRYVLTALDEKPDAA